MMAIRTALIRTSISLDGKLLTASGKPSRQAISDARLRNARELLLTIHPLIVGDDSTPTLSGLPGEFLPQDFRWELDSTAQGSGGKIMTRYRRKNVRARQVSRPFRGEA